MGSAQGSTYGFLGVPMFTGKQQPIPTSSSFMNALPAIGGVLGGIGIGDWLSQGISSGNWNPFQSPAEHNILNMQNPWAGITNIGDLAKFGYQPLNPALMQQAADIVYGNQVGSATAGAVQRSLSSGIAGAPVEASVAKARQPLDVQRAGQTFDILQLADQSNARALGMVMDAIQNSINFQMMQTRAMGQNSPFQDMLGLAQTGGNVAMSLAMLGAL